MFGALAGALGCGMSRGVRRLGSEAAAALVLGLGGVGCFLVSQGSEVGFCCRFSQVAVIVAVFVAHFVVVFVVVLVSPAVARESG